LLTADEPNGRRCRVRSCGRRRHSPTGPHRPSTEDIDLLTGHTTTAEPFRAALDATENPLTAAGFEVGRSLTAGTFARFHLHEEGEEALDVDFGINWRAVAPVAMTVGPVMSERDAIAGKLSAVYSRGEVGDFLDLDSIRATGRFTDLELLALRREHDDGFDALFALRVEAESVGARMSSYADLFAGHDS
jgi:hypothetical protein